MIDEVSQNQPPAIKQPAPPVETPQPTQPVVPMDKPKKKPGRGLIIGLVVFFLAVVGASGYMAWEKKGKQTTDTPPAAEEEATPTPNPTANWETYTNEDLTFKYPKTWEVKNHQLIGSNPEITLSVSSKDSTLMNECMKLDKTEEKEGYVLKKFSRVTTGEMCLTDDSTPRQIWVIPTEKDYSPGINYSYNVKDSLKAEELFSQILFTFRFLEKSQNQTSQSDSSECVKEGNRGNYFQKQSCCQELEELSISGPDCLIAPDGGFVCGNCRNSICGPGEDECNCPEDCL